MKRAKKKQKKNKRKAGKKIKINLRREKNSII